MNDVEMGEERGRRSEESDGSLSFLHEALGMDLFPRMVVAVAFMRARDIVCIWMARIEHVL